MFRSARRCKFTPAVSLCVSAIAGALVATASTSALALPPAVQSMQRVNAPVPVGDRITIMAIALGGSVALCVGANTLLDRPQPPRRLFANNSVQQPVESCFDQASRPLQRKLLRLLHDDRPLAERLFRQATLKYSGNTPNWYVEKVIYDLERDRGKI